MVTHVYTAAEMSPHMDIYDIIRRAMAHGYTGVTGAHKVDGDGDNYSLTIAEADDKTTVKTNLDAATVPTLSLTSYDVQVAGDGVASTTATLSDSRGAAASGKVVRLGVSNTDHLSPSPSATLDGSGEAVITFGPSPSAGWVGSFEVAFFYITDEAAKIVGKFTYT
jgi:hypothetical protein